MGVLLLTRFRCLECGTVDFYVSVFDLSCLSFFERSHHLHRPTRSKTCMKIDNRLPTALEAPVPKYKKIS